MISKVRASQLYGGGTVTAPRTEAACKPQGIGRLHRPEAHSSTVVSFNSVRFRAANKGADWVFKRHASRLTCGRCLTPRAGIPFGQAGVDPIFGPDRVG